MGSGAGPVTALLVVTKPAPEVRAAGGLVTRRAGAVVEVLVVHRPRYDDWSLPKGKADPGESDEDAARREVAEETGYVCALREELATIRYRDRRDRDKQVRYWHMTVEREIDWTPNDEIDERRWCSVASAATLLSYDADRRLVGNLTASEVRVEHSD
jgi:8-oxo-dGTP diphosphatase